MALFSRKTLQFVRAPDENVFIPRKHPSFLSYICLINTVFSAFNLIEILFISAPFEWWLSKESYERLNHYVMGIIYSPLLLITAWIETREARRIRRNRRRGEEDDTIQQEWEELAAEVDFDVAGTDWEQAVQESKPNVEVSACVLEIRQLKEQVRTLMETVRLLAEEKGLQSERGLATGAGAVTNGELS